MTSCKLGECSNEWAEKENGVFSYYLLEGLEGSADRDRDKVITITDAYNYTSENVKRWAFKRGLEQSPTLEAKISGDIPLVFVEKVLTKREEHVDKDVIKYITLSSLTHEDKGDRDGLIESMCGSLLQFYKASEIKLKTEETMFPHGFISPRLSTAEPTWLYYAEVCFQYEKRNWGRIDEVISFFDKKYYWNSIRFDLSKRIIVEELVQKCKESAFEIVSFMPAQGEESVTVDTEAWSRSKTTFRNLKTEGSEIVIFKGKDYYFQNNFYSTLSPENILEFLRNCLK